MKLCDKDVVVSIDSKTIATAESGNSTFREPRTLLSTSFLFLENAHCMILFSMSKALVLKPCIASWCLG